MLAIHLNGELKEIEESLSLLEILERFQIRHQSIAVAVNSAIVPRSEFQNVLMKEGDQVEIVQPVGGG